MYVLYNLYRDKSTNMNIIFLLLFFVHLFNTCHYKKQKMSGISILPYFKIWPTWICNWTALIYNTIFFVCQQHYMHSFPTWFDAGADQQIIGWKHHKRKYASQLQWGHAMRPCKPSRSLTYWVWSSMNSRLVIMLLLQSLGKLNILIYINNFVQWWLQNLAVLP